MIDIVAIETAHAAATGQTDSQSKISNESFSTSVKLLQNPPSTKAKKIAVKLRPK